MIKLLTYYYACAIMEESLDKKNKNNIPKTQRKIKMSKIITKIINSLQKEYRGQLIEVRVETRRLSFMDERLELLKDVEL